MKKSTLLCGIVLAVAGIGIAMAAGPAQKRSGPSPVLPGGNSRAPITVDAAKLEYFDKEQRLIYSGGVLARQGESTMRATTMVVFLQK